MRAYLPMPRGEDGDQPFMNGSTARDRRLMDADLAAKLVENSATIRKDVRKDSIRIGIGSFFAGGGLTLLITLLVHPLH